jgi:hypothetical protein
MTEPIKITKEKFLEIIDEPFEYDSWKWGHSCRFHVQIDGGDYVSQWIYCHYDDGMQLDDDDEVKLFPAVEIMIKSWMRIP